MTLTFPSDICFATQEAPRSSMKAFYYAYKNFSSSLFLQALEEGANPNANHHGRSALEWLFAFAVDHYEFPEKQAALLDCAALLFSHGARFDPLAMHSACRRAWPVGVLFLLSQTQDPHIKNHQGLTPLHSLMLYRQLDKDLRTAPQIQSNVITIMQALFQAKADIDAKNINGQSVLEFGRAMNSPWDSLLQIQHEAFCIAQCIPASLTPSTRKNSL